MSIRPQPKPQPREKKKPQGLRRGKPMRRTRIKARRARRLDDPKQSDPARLTWVHAEICEVRRREHDTRPGVFYVLTKRQAGCRGRIHACHEGEKKPGMGMKSRDGKSTAMCMIHDDDWTNHRGYFIGWDAERRRTWGDERGAAAEARYLSAGSRRAWR